MFKHLLDNVQYIHLFPIFTLILFVAFFVGLTWIVVKLDKKYINEVANLPLDNSEYTVLTNNGEQNG
jgi:cbb3-type cytochrome oxidase subunit 3